MTQIECKLFTFGLYASFEFCTGVGDGQVSVESTCGCGHTHLDHLTHAQAVELRDWLSSALAEDEEDTTG